MPQYWILKTEPDDYSFDDLEAEGATVWDGVKNNLALKHLRSMKKGDRVLIYHTGKVKALIGEASSPPAPIPIPARPMSASWSSTSTQAGACQDVKSPSPKSRPSGPWPIWRSSAWAGCPSCLPRAPQWKRLKAMGRRG